MKFEKIGEICFFFKATQKSEAEMVPCPKNCTCFLFFFLGVELQRIW